MTHIKPEASIKKWTFGQKTQESDRIHLFFVILIAGATLTSCATVVTTVERPHPPRLTPETFLIMGKGHIPVDSLALFLTKHNPRLHLFYAAKIA